MTFLRTSTSSLSTSKEDEGQQAEGLEEALQYDACQGSFGLIARLVRVLSDGKIS